MVRLDAHPLSPEPWPLHVHLIDDNTQVDGKACHFQTTIGSYHADIEHHPSSSAAQESAPKTCHCRSSAPTSPALSSPKPPPRRKSKPDYSPAAATPPQPQPLLPSPCPCSLPFPLPSSPSSPSSSCLPRSRRPSPSSPSKRARPAHDVDGPQTHTLAIKKRRLRLGLVTSRLSRPFSAPATHICLRRRGTTAQWYYANARFRRRLLLLLGVARRMGIGGMGMGIGMGIGGMGDHHYVRKAAILNPSRPVEQQRPLAERSPPSPPPPSPSPPSSSKRVDVIAAEEDAEISFPGSAVRYADLSDEDDTGDDVYADFGVLFGPGAAEGGGGGGKADYEGYLDELDGLRWGA
ncbi:hypothetical protein F5X96DRAFT_672984 [Biscogniauxia mediterranea]|nr:hypothetical protein F5X96DRAFT_672984 [Biscogniauxia mediterranea]